MQLPGPLRWLSLGASIVLASPPTVMAVISLADGDYMIGAVFLAVALVAFALPELLVRRLPGPREVVAAYRPRPVATLKRRLLGSDEDDTSE